MHVHIATINPQNYTDVNFRKSAQYSNSASKTFTVGWLKRKSTMPLINFYTWRVHFCELQSFVKNVKVKYS